MSLPFGVEQLQEAWERVPENEGCAGSDAVTIRQFAQHADKRLPELLERVRDGRYRPYPLLKIVVENPGAADACGLGAAVQDLLRAWIKAQVWDGVKGLSITRRNLPWFKPTHYRANGQLTLAWLLSGAK